MRDLHAIAAAAALACLLSFGPEAYGNGATTAKGDALPQPSKKMITRLKGKWQRVFQEEFDKPELNGKRWTTCYWWNKDGCTNLGAQELSWYRPENVTIADGVASLTARKEPAVTDRGVALPFTSGMLTTGRDYAELPRPPRFSFTYGMVEIRAKVPTGQGLWPALWLLPSSRQSRPEIDIMEVLGDSTDQLRMHFHYLDKKGERQSAGETVNTVPLDGGFHVYGLLWQPDKIVWYLDGKEKFRFDDRKFIPAESMYLILNLAVGGRYPGPPDPRTGFPKSFEIDYVRVWQRIK